MSVNFFLFFLFVCLGPTDGAFMDWFWGTNDDIARNGEPSKNSHLLRINYEAKSEDEKFLEEALKFTDLIKSSALDVCQHNVVLKIKTSCSGMTEEELAKMSVNLLNCQSEVDGRRIFPCTEEMSLKQCTVDMDAHTWNAYHMMNNRARAVCLASRREQFQALSELTVNKLLLTSQDQISRMAAIQRGQEELGAVTAETMGSIREGNVQLLLHQKALEDGQRNLQSHVSYNMKELLREKALIAAGHRELSALTQTLKDKLDEANKELVLQSLERAGNHEQLLNDIINIQKQSEAIYKKIDESTEKLLFHQDAMSEQYEETLKNLARINSTINYLTKLFTTTHEQLEQNIDWIKSYLGDSGEELNRITTIISHVAYLLMGMLLASFLQFPLLSRLSLAIMVPANLFYLYTEKNNDMTLDFWQMTIFILSITLVNVLVNGIIGYVSPPVVPRQYIMSQTMSNGYTQPPPRPTVFQRISSKTANFYCGLSSMFSSRPSRGAGTDQVDGRRNENDTHYDSLLRDTPASRVNTPIARHKNNSDRLVSSWLEHSRDAHRADSPSSSSARSGSWKLACNATCKNGNRCKNPRRNGYEFCNMHS